MICLISASTSVALETSVLTKSPWPPAAWIRRTVSCPPSATTSATTTFAPSRANVRAEALPMPEPLPVTSATLPSSRPAMVFSPLCVDCTYQKNLVHVRDLCVLAIWSAGAVLPLSLGEAVLRPCSVPSMALDHKSASMACALQKGVLRVDFIREPGILRQFLKQRLGLL